jgi:hypothetical protein
MSCTHAFASRGVRRGGSLSAIRSVRVALLDGGGTSTPVACAATSGLLRRDVGSPATLTAAGWLDPCPAPAAMMLCSLEFVGRSERTGWKLAEKLTPMAYIGWSLWLVGTGIALVA